MGALRNTGTRWRDRARRGGLIDRFRLPISNVPTCTLSRDMSGSIVPDDVARAESSITPREYTRRVVAQLPGVFTFLWLQQEVLKQWVGVTPESHPLLYFCIGTPTVVFYLSHTDVLTP